MTALTEVQAVTVAKGVAAGNGLTLDTDALAAVVARLSTDLGLDENRSLVFDIAAPFQIEGGKVVDTLPLAHALSVVREHGRPVPVPASTPEAPTTRPGKIQVETPIASFGRQLDAQHAAAMAREAETYPNPWLPNQTNRTRQAIITKHAPALAARYKAEAAA